MVDSFSQESPPAATLLACNLLAGVTTAPAVYTLGRHNMADTQYAAAEAAFRRCLGLQPDDLRGLTGLAEVYARQNKAAEAIPIWGEARAPGKH